MTRKSSSLGAAKDILKALKAGRANGLPFVPRGSDGQLKREDFKPELIEFLRKAGEARGETWVMSDEAREQTRSDILARHTPNEPLWVFGYGSLMWNPAIYVDETMPATLYGFHRAFCLALHFGRGSPEAPGLMLALLAGGACRGAALKIAAKHVESETKILWMREMLAGAYRPRWVDLRTANGPVKAVTFVANPGHSRFLGKLDEDAAARRIATGQGILGQNRTYLYNTVEELKRLGITDRPITRLARKVRAAAGETNTH